MKATPEVKKRQLRKLQNDKILVSANFFSTDIYLTLKLQRCIIRIHHNIKKNIHSTY